MLPLAVLVVAAVATGPSAAAVATGPSAAAVATPSAALAQTDTSYKIGVLEVDYFPLTPDGRQIDISVTGDVNDTLKVTRARVAEMTTALRGHLSRGTRYRGFENPKAPPALTYKLVDRIEFDAPVPSVQSAFNQSYPNRADYQAIFRGFDICDYVENQDVQEVWIWAYQGPNQLDISESKMSSPYGDISNSYRLDDLPHCGRTYTVYTFNYGRGVALAVHSYGHQLEAELTYMDDHLFRELFMGPNYPATLKVVGRCGSVHNPPNAREEYDWANPEPNESDCDAWQPDGMAETSTISCKTWGCEDNGEDSDPQLRYLVWWMQHFPGRTNTLTYDGQPMRNWWDIHGDFDATLATSRSLTLAVAREPTPTVQASATTSVARSLDETPVATPTPTAPQPPLSPSAADVGMVVAVLLTGGLGALVFATLLARKRRPRGHR